MVPSRVGGWVARWKPLKGRQGYKKVAVEQEFCCRGRAPAKMGGGGNITTAEKKIGGEEKNGASGPEETRRIADLSGHGRG